MLQGENEALKTGAEKIAAEKSALEGQLAARKAAAEALQAQVAGAAAQAAQASSDREQLRQSQAQAADAGRRATEAQNSNRVLAEENTRLKATIASVSQTVGRITAAPAPAANPPAPARLMGTPPTGPNSPTRPGTPQALAATTPPAPPAPPPPVTRTHVVAPGDTLGKISRQYYGTQNRWPDILAANRSVLRDERSLVVGRTLRIP